MPNSEWKIFEFSGEKKSQENVPAEKWQDRKSKMN